jgi:hypothetical protein
VDKKLPKEKSLLSLASRSKEIINSDSDDSINTEDDVIVLDDTLEEKPHAPSKIRTNSKPQQNDMDSLLCSFDSIKIDTKNAASCKPKSPKVESSVNDVYVPFSQRMKTIYKNASIFDK